MAIIGSQQTKSVKTIIIIFLARAISFPFEAVTLALDIECLMPKYMMI